MSSPPSIAPNVFRVDDDGATLLGGYSPTSGHRHFPRSPVCPFTGADDVQPIDLPRTGRLWLWTEGTPVRLAASTVPDPDGEPASVWTFEAAGDAR